MGICTRIITRPLELHDRDTGAGMRIIAQQLSVYRYYIVIASSNAFAESITIPQFSLHCGSDRLASQGLLKRTQVGMLQFHGGLGFDSWDLAEGEFGFPIIGWELMIMQKKGVRSGALVTSLSEKTADDLLLFPCLMGA